MNIIILFAWISAIIYPIWNLLWMLPIYYGWKTPNNKTIILDLKEEELPTITILLPLHKESIDVVSNLFASIAQLEYPKNKLDIKTILEHDDHETLNAVKEAMEEINLEIEIVLNRGRKVKPAALNVALKTAKGEIVTVYDAEDAPEIDQLKKVVSCFVLNPDIACIQAKLNYYNSDQNMLTKFFTIEYSSWFDIYLKGWQKIGWIIPLGGTSNFIKKDVILKLNGWDENNVTEDAELGIRLVRNGYRVEIIDSTTWEEAVPHINHWIKQRSRWHKGFLQCFITHCKDPIKLVKDVGLWRAISFVLIGISPLIIAFNLIMWFFTILYILYFFGFYILEPIGVMIIDAFSNPWVFYPGLCCFVFGNISWIMFNLSGTIRRENWKLIKYVNFLIPYWLLMSIAAWRGIIELIIKPVHWHKTPHGFSNNKNNRNNNNKCNNNGHNSNR